MSEQTRDVLREAGIEYQALYPQGPEQSDYAIRVRKSDVERLVRERDEAREEVARARRSEIAGLQEINRLGLQVERLSAAPPSGEASQGEPTDDKPERRRETPDKAIRCRGCDQAIIPDERIADGCPCNSPRGINHGLVPTHVCTCKECDPSESGSVRGRGWKGSTDPEATRAPSETGAPTAPPSGEAVTVIEVSSADYEAASAFFSYGATRGNHDGPDGTGPVPGPLTPYIHQMGVLVRRIYDAAMSSQRPSGEAAQGEPTASLPEDRSKRVPWTADFSAELAIARSPSPASQGQPPAPPSGEAVTDAELLARYHLTPSPAGTLWAEDVVFVLRGLARSRA